jgi:hypothetical protein
MTKRRSLTIEDRIEERLQRNMTYQQIIADLHVSPKRILRVKKLLELSNMAIAPLPIGRPPIINDSITQTIDEMTLNFPKLGGHNLSCYIAQKLGLTISKSTVNRIRQSLHYRFQSPRQQPFLTEKQMEKRIEFATAQLKGPINWSSNVILSDESRFGLEDDSQRIWVKRGTYNKQSFRQKSKVAKSIMVWGAISKGWRSPLVVITGNLNSQGYIDLLDENKIFQQLDDHFGKKQYYFEQDGAPPHRSKLSVTWIEERANLISQWPPNSPDLTGIENIWAIMKQKISGYEVQSITELKEHLQREWWAIPQTTIDAILASTPQRFQLVINENGRSIGHLLHRASIKKLEGFKRKEEDQMKREEVQLIEEREDYQLSDDCQPNENVEDQRQVNDRIEILMILPRSNPPKALVEFSGKRNTQELIPLDQLKKIAPEEYLKFLESKIVTY